MEASLIIPAFIAGILTLLAPCTLPLVPGYLGFISGVSASDLQNPSKSKMARGKIFLNGVLYVIGFSLVFIILGSLFGLTGVALAKYRIWLSRIGGIFVIFFGLFMMGILKLPFLNVEKRIGNIKILKPGTPASSLVFGATFAFGWTPCVGPILGSILTLAASSATVGQGAFLLAVFSAGLAVPFLAIAASVSSASRYLAKISKYLNVVSIIGGVFLVFLGILLLTNNFNAWLGYFYRIFDFINYDRLLDYL
ncbi:MAG: sulfite exporter TauE/SafE family protein [Candidatus Colwellbacteria bacterium]|nr:sulfite exporter TauE/SafE family protein [Candidatus Colwellbacteria bacterium]